MILLDTAFVAAVLNKGDQHHANAKVHLAKLQNERVVVTEAVLTEAGSMCAAMGEQTRQSLVQFIRACYGASNTEVIEVDSQLFSRGLEKYEKFKDKEWSIVDCISFIVMEDKRIKDALTSDHHFEQAGFIALLRS